MSRTPWLLATPPPAVAVEIARHRVSAAAVAARDGRLAVAAHAIEPLPDGAVVPGLNSENVPDVGVVAAVLRRAFDRIGGRPRRVALAIPDCVAKVSLLRFEKVPERARDLEELLRWQVRKAAPFPLEDAQISWMPGVEPVEGGREFVVVLARRDIVRQYEAICEAAGAQAGIVDLSTFGVINAVLASPHAPAGDWLLVHVTPEDATMAILRGAHLVFFRNRGAEGEGSLADLVHQTAMYYEDRLGGRGFGRVVLAAPEEALAVEHAGFAGALEERLHSRVQLVDPRRAAHLAPGDPASGEELVSIAAPLGALLREAA